MLQSKTEFPFLFQEPSGTLKDKAKINSDYRFKICPSFTGWFGGADANTAKWISCCFGSVDFK